MQYACCASATVSNQTEVTEKGGSPRGPLARPPHGRALQAPPSSGSPLWGPPPQIASRPSPLMRWAQLFDAVSPRTLPFKLVYQSEGLLSLRRAIHRALTEPPLPPAVRLIHSNRLEGLSPSKPRTKEDMLPNWCDQR